MSDSDDNGGPRSFRKFGCRLDRGPGATAQLPLEGTSQLAPKRAAPLQLSLPVRSPLAVKVKPFTPGQPRVSNCAGGSCGASRLLPKRHYSPGRPSSAQASAGAIRVGSPTGEIWGVRTKVSPHSLSCSMSFTGTKAPTLLAVLTPGHISFLEDATDTTAFLTKFQVRRRPAQCLHCYRCNPETTLCTWVRHGHRGPPCSTY